MIGLILMTMGVMIFFVGQFLGENKDKAKKQFWNINTGVLLLIPCSCIFNFLQSVIGRNSFIFKPIFHLGNSFVIYGLGWTAYIVICVLLCKILSEKN